MATQKNTTAAKQTAQNNNKQANAGSQQKQDNSNSKQSEPLLDKLFVDMLKDIYWAEKHLVGALKDMESKATTDELQEAFADHRHQTEKHVTRLEKVFSQLGREPEAKKCEAMAGLTKEAEAMAKETEDGTMTRDAALIIAAQKVEHYEIATYGSLVQVARTLGYDNAASLLEKTLWEEEDTDSLLTDIAETFINPKADMEDEEENESVATPRMETA